MNKPAALARKGIGIPQLIDHSIGMIRRMLAR
jgi:hypothetical protein